MARSPPCSTVPAKDESPCGALTSSPGTKRTQTRVKSCAWPAFSRACFLELLYLAKARTLFYRSNFHEWKSRGIKGRIKEAVGDLTDNQDLKDSGKEDKAAGKLKQGVERVINKARDMVKKP
jgi:uncharacterized protein YjbJ (UPF0337 family)